MKSRIVSRIFNIEIENKPNCLIIKLKYKKLKSYNLYHINI